MFLGRWLMTKLEFAYSVFWHSAFAESTAQDQTRPNDSLGSVWREAKMSNREEKEKFENNFSNFEREKRNFKPISPLSRGEREIWKRFSTFERRKRNMKTISPLSRREWEICKAVRQFREEKEKSRVWIFREEKENLFNNSLGFSKIKFSLN